ncbi:Aste57867_18269 [Aphanomyces stellatus]|uniref:Aste57867_18269 protein n=1 Tax=Aphanomyces stellatus TaxID=120398 RepID=A0A485LB92_9STRA|nr:hypothetical protein As57867_018207 [Aphanomyces stellatus]VFT95006.1 Aste57867_18269 [Aphanomyces stellatus]
MTAEGTAAAQLRACEEKLVQVNEYKKNELTELFRCAEEAMRALEEEKQAIEAALPGLMEHELQKAVGRRQQMDAMEASASKIETKLKQLYVHTGELCAILEPQTKQLTALQSKIQYFNLLLEVETLSTRAKEHDKGNIDALVALAGLSQSLSTAFGLDMSFQLHLRTLIQARMKYLSADMKEFHTQALDASLVELDWPQCMPEADFKAKATQLNAFCEKFTRLVQVQMSLASMSPEGVESEITDLWAMHRLLRPLTRRFHFHFETDNKTNDLAKPEWYLTHVLELFRGHAVFLESYVAPALAAALVSTNYAKPGCDGRTLFIHGLLQTLRYKIKHTLPVLLLNKPLFCHTVDEVVDFEWKLRSDFGYRAPRLPNQKFRHVLDEFALNAKALDLWMQIDLEYAQRFLATYIQEDDHAWDVVLDDDDHKVTNVAYAIAATFDVLTKRFQLLSDATHRYGYVANVLKPWLYQCHVEAIERFGRQQHISQALYLPTTVHPTWKTFSAALNSESFVQKLLVDHDEAKVYLELLPTAKVTVHRTALVPLKLKQKVAGLSKAVLNPLLETQEAKNVTHGLLGQGSLVLPTAAFSAAFSVGSSLLRNLQGPVATSGSPKAAKPADEVAEEYTLEGSMFQNEWTWCQHTVHAMEESLASASFSAIRAQWGHYAASPMWASPPPAGDRLSPDVSPELGYGLALFRHHLTCAHAHLNTVSFDMYWKAVAKDIDAYLLSTILTNKMISKHGRLQLIHDVDAVGRVLRPYTARPDAYLRRYESPPRLND